MNHAIYRWLKQGLVKSEHQQQALQLAGERPSRTAWLSFCKKLLMLVGLLSLAFGVLFFFAFNWNELGRIFKFIIIQLLLVGLFVGYFLNTKSFWLSQALLLAAVIVLGGLLALFGQTYQTGADPWQLFATWALLILPLVVFSRSEVLWIVWAVLINMALSLYLNVNHSIFRWVFLSQYLPWVFLLVNGVLLLLLEWISGHSTTVLKHFKLKQRWAAQVLGLTVFFLLSVIGMEAIWGDSGYRSANSLLYLSMMVGGFYYYRYQAKDLLLVTAWAMAVIVFILTLLAHTVFDGFDAGGFLLMALSLIGMTAWAVKWIKQIQQLFQAEQSV